MKILGIIPARYASSRFPGKPLVDIGGRTMIRRVYEQAVKAKALANVLVATDDERIFSEVKGFSGEVIMTASQHANGTSRCLEVLQRQSVHYDYAINIQGDEPFVDPAQIDLLCSILDQNTQIATLIKKIDDPDHLFNPGVMKVVFTTDKKALYFSRQCIPHVRGLEQEKWFYEHPFYKHIGIYAYRADILKEINKLAPGTWESAESLEQLRWLENGYEIKLARTNIDSHMVDTPEDLDYINQHFL